jgi:hypothetical protein
MGIGDDKSIHREDTKAKDCGLQIADCRLKPQPRAFDLNLHSAISILQFPGCRPLEFER